MNRPICFRAWDKKNRIMRIIRALFFRHDGFINEIMVQQPVNRSLEGEIFTESSDLVLMQFTGLTDSKGVHIWEGDVLGLIEPEVDGKQNHFGRVQVLFGEYDDSEIEYGSPAIGWYVEGYHGYKRINGSRDKYEIGGHDSHWSLLRCTTHREKWEVLGNVWEHPHLLNGEVNG